MDNNENFDFNEDFGEDDDLESILDMELLDNLLSEGLDIKKPKKNMNPNSLDNLKKGNIKNPDEKKLRAEEIEKSVQKEAAELLSDQDNLIGYYQKILTESLVKERIILNELYDSLLSEKKSQKEKNMITKQISTIHNNISILGDALKAQPKQHEGTRESNPATISQKLEEIRRNQPSEIATSPDAFKKKLEELKEQQRKNLESGDSK